MKIFRKNRKVYYFDLKKAFHGSFVATSLEMYSRTSALHCRGRTSGIRFVSHFCKEDKRHFRQFHRGVR